MVWLEEKDMSLETDDTMGGTGNRKDRGLQETIKEYIYLMLNYYSHVLGISSLYF